MIGDDIEVVVVRIGDDKVRLGISAPQDTTILRSELVRAIPDTPLTGVPDGSYVGKWGGHELSFDGWQQTFFVRTKRGIRGIDNAVTFSVVDSKVVEESIARVAEEVD